MFIDAQLLGRAMHDSAKADQYTEYIRSKWRENLNRSRRGLDPVIPESPQGYFHASTELMNGISRNSNKLYSAALTFAVAHEVGHHVLNHEVRDRVHSVEREKAADQWAMDAMIAAGEPPTAALMVMTFFSSFFAADPSHPSPDERELSMIRETLAHLDRFEERARENGFSIERYREQLKAGLQQLSDENNTASLPSTSSSRDSDTFLGGFNIVLDDLPSHFRNILGAEKRRSDLPPKFAHEYIEN
jgi:hypothetical protein